MNRGFALIPLLLLISSAPAQDETKPVISKDPLTAEQIAIYRAVLVNYTNGDDISLNLANRTEPISLAFQEDNCLRGIDLHKTRDAKPVVHLLDPAVALSPKMALVDPDQQNAAVEKNDPDHLIHRAIDNHEPVSDKELEDSVKQAFATGLFTFSEIAFNSPHTRAVLAYSFHCGMLCGNGNKVVLKKVGGKWKVAKSCGGWVS